MRLFLNMSSVFIFSEIFFDLYYLILYSSSDARNQYVKMMEMDDGVDDGEIFIS